MLAGDIHNLLFAIIFTSIHRTKSSKPKIVIIFCIGSLLFITSITELIAMKRFGLKVHVNCTIDF